MRRLCLFSKLIANWIIRVLKQVVPPEDADNVAASRDLGPVNTSAKPAFSLPLMTNNFRRFNARSVSHRWVEGLGDS